MKRRHLLLVALLVACGRRPTPGPSPSSSATTSASSSSSATPAAFDPKPAWIGADVRREGLVPSAMSTSTDVRARRAATRALAQIGDVTVVERLGKALSDEDPEVVAWAAYGLGVPCDADADLPRDVRAKLVAALSARALSLEGEKPTADKATGTLDPFAGLAFGLGRCGGLEASRALVHWLERSPERAEAAAFALGAIAQRDKGLEDDVASALVAAARGGKQAPVAAALFPFGRGDWSGRPPTPGLAEVARLRVAGGGPLRTLAIRALGRAAGAKVEDLRPLLDAPTPPAEVVEALRALHRLGSSGDAAIAAFATRNAPVDAATTTALLQPGFGPLRVALELLAERSGEKNATVQTSLRAFLPVGAGPIPAGTAPTVARRLATVRCLAAAALHPGHPADPEIVRCAAHDASLPAPLKGELDRLRDRARLLALDRGEIVGDKRDLLVRLANDGPAPQRELALELFARHAETEEAPDVVARSLGAKALGVVAAAAQAVADRPALAGRPPKKDEDKPAKTDADKPTKADDKADGGVDGGPPAPPSADPRVLTALDGALSRPLEEADAEVAIALAGAVGALRHAPGRGFLTRLCGDRSPALRRAARTALAALDGAGKAPLCAAAVGTTTPHPLIDTKLDKPTVELTTEVGTLTLTLDPRWAPVAARRIAELAAGGFYDGTVVHRVVPGFVVQLGDPGGDGYGGAHSALRCETAPVPFQKGSIGVALAGRDTGSSQFFVMLGRAPHLDGSYAHLGEATGPWELVAEGDVVEKARAK